MYEQKNNKERQLLLFTKNCKQWHTELCEYKRILIKTKLKFIFILFAKFLKGKKLNNIEVAVV